MIKFDLCPPDSLWVYPIAKLGSGFSIYLELVKAAGGKFNDEVKRHKISLSSFKAFVEELEANQFQPKLSMEVMIAVSTYNEQRKLEVLAAGDRVTIADQKLRERGLELYKYQAEGVDRLANETNLLLGDQPGLGKTLQALLAAPADRPMLVVCPAVAKGVWETETAKWRPDVLVTVLSGRGGFRWPRGATELAADLNKCVYCSLPFDPEKRNNGLQTSYDIATRVQHPAILSEVTFDSFVKHGGANVDQAAQGGQPIHQNEIGVPHLDAPCSGFPLDLVDSALTVDDTSQVTQLALTGRQVKQRASSLSGGDSKAPNNKKGTQTISAHSQLTGNFSVSSSSLQSIKSSGDAAVTVLCSRCSHPLPPASTITSEACVVNYDILPPTSVECSSAHRAWVDAKKLLKEWEEGYAKRKAQPFPISEKEELERQASKAKLVKAVEVALKRETDLKYQFVAKLPLEGTTLVADECHTLKGKSLRTSRFNALSKAVRAKRGRCWGLTGTPLLNRPPELYKLLSCLDLATKAFGTWPTFVQLFGGKKNPFGGMEWGVADPSVPERMKRVCLRRLRADVLTQLPTKTWRYHRVEIDKATAKLCDEATGELAKVGIDLDEAKDLAKVTAVKGAGFELLSKARMALAAVKLPAALALVEELEEQEEPVLVFASHRGPIDVIAKRPGWLSITGSTTEAQRKIAVEAFQRGALKGLALTIQAGGTALTLTKAAQVIFIDRAWTPALNEQAEDRVLRHGQTRGVVITIMEANHAIDYRVNELLLLKQALVEGALGDTPRGDQ